MRSVLLAAVVVASLAACAPASQGPMLVSSDSVLACQEAVKARGGMPGASFEQVDVQPGRNPPVQGYAVTGGQRAPFTCTLDAGGQVSGVTIDGQAR